jgi:hypothetical protein
VDLVRVAAPVDPQEPLTELQPGVLSRLPATHARLLTGKEFFPHLIAGAFHHGLVVVFIAAAIMAGLAAVVSLMRGGHSLDEEPAD